MTSHLCWKLEVFVSRMLRKISLKKISIYNKSITIQLDGIVPGKTIQNPSSDKKKLTMETSQWMVLSTCLLICPIDPLFLFCRDEDPVLAEFRIQGSVPRTIRIVKILLNENSRYFCKPSFLFSYFWCQTFSVICRALDPDPDLVRILTDPDPGEFSGSRASMERLTQKIKNTKGGLANYLENLLIGILNIFHRPGPRAPDPYPDPKIGTSSLLFCPFGHGPLLAMLSILWFKMRLELDQQREEDIQAQLKHLTKATKSN